MASNFNENNGALNSRNYGPNEAAAASGMFFKIANIFNDG